MCVKPDKLRSVGINLHRFVDSVGKYSYELDTSHKCVDVIEKTRFHTRVYTSIDLTSDQLAMLSD